MKKFGKTLGKFTRQPVTKKRFEGATGTDYKEEVKKGDLQAQYDAETDEEKKKKIKQRAHFLGQTLE